MQLPRIDEQRASTPTIDERRDPMSSQVNINKHYWNIFVLITFMILTQCAMVELTDWIVR